MKRLFLILLALPLIAQGAGRVFHDNFEGGVMSSQWTNDTAFADNCLVVSTAVDGGLSHDGSGQLQCYWHGGAAQPHAHSNEALPSWNYNREFFTRIWFRFDKDTDASFGWPHVSGSAWYYAGEGLAFTSISPLGYNTNGGQNQIGVSVTAHMAIESAVDKPDGSLHVSWLADGGGYSGPNFFGYQYLYDGQEFGPLYPSVINTVDHQWHELELYHKDDTFTNGVTNNDGTTKTWIDHHLVVDVENDHTTINGARWNNFGVGAYWNNSNGLTTNNHVYYDGIEIYSDYLNDGSTGSMSDASIQVPVTCQ